jgi:hypothetical protein
MKRYLHNLSHYKIGTAELGKLYPVSWQEVLPNDTFDMSTSVMMRFQQMVTPAMHPVEVRVHQFFVPNRILWSEWEDFITGKAAPEIPTINTTGNFVNLAGYLGFLSTQAKDLSCLPFRAYNLIYNEYFRDQDLIPEVSLDSREIQRIAWQKDQFTTARPSPQQGSAITLPLGTSAPITGAAGFTIGGTPQNVETDSIGALRGSPAVSSVGIDTSGLTADLANASSIDVIAFRRALALQREKEARSRYGDEYVDLLSYMGARPQDSRLQRPEYLSGGKRTIQFSEVLDTSGSGTGDLYGHGIGAVKSNRYRKTFPEHGIIMTMMSVRPKSLYESGLHRSFTKKVKEDYFFKEFERIGQREVKNSEVYADHSDPDGTFGYNNRYQEYREVPSTVSGQMGAGGYSDDYHFARVFTSDVSLNQDFVECDPDLRPMATILSHPLTFMCYHKVAARRIVSPNPEPSIL